MRLAADHYLKGLRFWTSVEEIELKPIFVPDKSLEMRRQIQCKEADLLLEQVSKRKGPLYLLDEDGKALSSQGWAKLLKGAEDSSAQGLIFCIGSSLGFSDGVRASAAEIISLGPHTLPHELARVVLCEQLFRATSILKGHPYHNEG